MVNAGDCHGRRSTCTASVRVAFISIISLASSVRPDTPSRSTARSTTCSRRSLTSIAPGANNTRYNATTDRRDSGPTPSLNTWREVFEGVECKHTPTGLVVSGAIDDLWYDPETEEYIVVDYKATAKAVPVTELDQAWQDGYKRQMEVYQWLLRCNGLQVSDRGYFVYCTGRPNEAKFGGKLEFDINLIEYVGNADWVEDTTKRDQGLPGQRRYSRIGHQLRLLQVSQSDWRLQHTPGVREG